MFLVPSAFQAAQSFVIKVLMLRHQEKATGHSAYSTLTALVLNSDFLSTRLIENLVERE